MKSGTSRKNLWIDYGYIVMIIIYAGAASEFVFSLTSWKYPVGLLIPVIYTTYLVIDRKVTFSYAFIFLILGFSVYFIASTLKYRALHPKFFATYIIFFFVSYVILNVFKHRFIIIFIKIIYYLCIISLFFWIVELFAQDTLRQILQPFTVTSPSEEHINIIVYTIRSEALTSNFEIPRNSGFAWEPGIFACYIDLAIFSLLISKKFDILKDLKFWVLTLSLITTQSTTGYSIFLVILAFYAYNQKFKYVIALYPIIFVLVIYVFTLPVMTQKLVEVSSFDTQLLIYNSVKYDYTFIPQRFQSFQIDFIDFSNSPVIGYGGHKEAKWTEQLGAEINTASGIGNLLAVFGVIGLLFFIYQLIKTSKDFSNSFGYKGWFFQFIILVMFSISYSLFTPLLFCFWLMRSDYLPRMELLKFKVFSSFFHDERKGKPSAFVKN